VVAVVGATGAVGREMLRCLFESSLPVREVKALASERSEGKRLLVADLDVVVEVLTPQAFQGVDIALFSAGAGRSRQFAPAAVEHGAVVIDNSSAFRMDDDVPLVVPEVNMEAARHHRGIIANPNCSTIQMVLPLKVLADDPGMRRVVVSTYQSASGAGQSGITELLDGTKELLDGREPVAETFAHPLPFEVLPHIGSFDESGYTTEELKMTYETRKILGLPELDVSATCVRVPVLRGHSEAVTVDLAAKADLESIRRRFAELDNLEVMDDTTRNIYPLARVADGRNETFVGRIRGDIERPDTIHFWVVSDNLLKGAAFNAVQIAEGLVDLDLVQPSR
jgi:aspartate-semialdehyde dehydrogenase